MTRIVLAVLWLSLLFATRALDAAITWYYDPGLVHEANPWHLDCAVRLHRMLGYGILLVPVGMTLVWAEVAFFRNEFRRAQRASTDMEREEKER